MIKPIRNMIKTFGHKFKSHCGLCKQWMELWLFDTELQSRVCEDCADLLEGAEKVLERNGLTPPNTFLSLDNP
jgi:hypothetical protein